MPALGSADTPTTECDVLVDNCRLGRRLLLSAIVATFSRMCQRARSTTASPLVPTDSRLNHRAVILSHPSLIVLHPSPLSSSKKKVPKSPKNWGSLANWAQAVGTCLGAFDSGEKSPRGSELDAAFFSAASLLLLAGASHQLVHGGSIGHYIPLALGWKSSPRG